MNKITNEQQDENGLSGGIRPRLTATQRHQVRSAINKMWSEAESLPFYNDIAIHAIKRICGFATDSFYRIAGILLGGPDTNPTRFQKWCRSGKFIGWK